MRGFPGEVGSKATGWKDENETKCNKEK